MPQTDTDTSSRHTELSLFRTFRPRLLPPRPPLTSGELQPTAERTTPRLPRRTLKVSRDYLGQVTDTLDRKRKG